MAATETPLASAPHRRFFQAVLDALLAGNVPFAVAGAFAFQRYTGIARQTKDLDLFLPVEALPHALAICAHAGWVVEVPDPVWLAKVRSGEPFVDLITGMSNGVIWVRREWIKSARRVRLLGRNVRLLAPEEMIVSKIFVTRRERFDGSDICHLIYRRGERLDWPRIVAALGPHWELLLWHLSLYRYIYPGAPGVPPALWRNLRRRRPPRHAQFRGSLIDPLMFAPDVAAWGLANLEAKCRAARMQAAPPLSGHGSPEMSRAERAHAAGNRSHDSKRPTGATRVRSGVSTKVAA